MTRYFYDCEFLEDGRTVDLISIGIVTEDGREYYAVNKDADWDRIRQDEWLVKNVVAHLPLSRTVESPVQGSRKWFFNLDPKSVLIKPKYLIANEVREFLLEDVVEHIIVDDKGAEEGPIFSRLDLPELWAYYGAYDHIALAQLLGGKMINLPKGIPMWTHELMQFIEPLGPGWKKPEHGDDEHDALADARWNLELFNKAFVELSRRKLN